MNILLISIRLTIWRFGDLPTGVGSIALIFGQKESHKLLVGGKSSRHNADTSGRRRRDVRVSQRQLLPCRQIAHWLFCGRNFGRVLLIGKMRRTLEKLIYRIKN
ncbi:MAG: hypothetical protein COB16_00555 [Rhodobacteraceae bacterium]|nr:MAG: hypothetical protein COB16_00555 [Paracoccaceae bacterium]